MASPAKALVDATGLTQMGSFNYAPKAPSVTIGQNSSVMRAPSQITNLRFNLTKDMVTFRIPGPIAIFAFPAQIEVSASTPAIKTFPPIYKTRLEGGMVYDGPRSFPPIFVLHPDINDYMGNQ